MTLRELPVIWRERYIATWRGKAIFSGTAFAGHVGQADVEMLGDTLLDCLDVDGEAALFVKQFAQQLLRLLQVGLAAREREV